MTRQALKIGDQVEVSIDGQREPVTGEVVTFRILKDRQLATLRTPYGDRAIVLHLTDAPKPAVLVPPVDVAAARQVAFSVLAGDDHRLPITASTNLLAAAVITLTGGAA